MKFLLTKEYVEELEQAIKSGDKKQSLALVEGLHPADIAEVSVELAAKDASVLLLTIEPEIASQVLAEIEDDERLKLLEFIPPKFIASHIIEAMDSDDATDALQQLPEGMKEEVIKNLKDAEHAGDIADLLHYDEDTAGGLMAKELVRVNEKWTVGICLTEIRSQASQIDDIYYVYVVDDENVLKGILPIKRLIENHGKVYVSDICEDKIISVKTNTDSEEVANVMEKYNLVALPVVDDLNRLLGRITIDDVVDVIREEAEKDYQMVSGIASDVESSDNVVQQTKARLPWLLIGLLGGILGAQIIGTFEDELKMYTGLTLFLPMIAAMAGNVGVQSSSIIVQSLAASTVDIESNSRKLFKELMVGLVNGFICSSLIFLYNFIFSDAYTLTFSVSLALFVVIIFASVFGTFVPLILNKLKVDPALATGPFITTVNDIAGLFIYLLIARNLYTYF